MSNSYTKIEIASQKHYALFFDFQCNKKSCGRVEHFTEYLLYNAMSDYATGIGTTHVMCEYVGDEPKAIKGYISLKAATLITGADENDRACGEPAIEISELAVDKRYERQGIGKDLLLHALRTCKRLHDEHVGVMHLIVCADPKSVPFYKHVLHFSPIARHYSIPSESWNTGCTPMYLKLEGLFQGETQLPTPPRCEFT